MSALSPVAIRELNIKFDDAGLMPRVVKLQQRVAPVDGKPTAEQLQAYEARMAKSESDCASQALRLGIAGTEEMCASVSRFMKNEAGSLVVSATPTPPVQVMKLVMQMQMGSQQGIAKVFQQLNLKISN